MNTHVPRTFRLSEGIDAYNPEITAEALQFFFLTNIEPRLGRLVTTRGYASFQTAFGSSPFVGFSYYQLSNRQYSNLYAFTQTSVYWFDFKNGVFSTSPIYSSFPDTPDPYVFLPWYDALYVTKLYGGYLKLTRTVTEVLGGGVSGRYGVIANSHAYLGGVSDGVSTEMARVRWSDLDAPEDFVIDQSASEADFFDLEPNNGQITGVSYQRSNTVIYTEHSIWVGSYVGYPGGFRHDPLFPGLGNIFHDSVVRAKEIDYFIGADNIYALNGFQPVPVGDKIFERFIADVVLTPAGGANTTSVRGYLDTRKNQVFWVYPSISKTLWSIVFNYKENKWSERDPQQLTGWLDSPRVALRGYDVINDIATTIDNVATLIDDPAGGYPVLIPQLVGLRNAVTAGGSPIIGKVTDAYVKLDSTAFTHTLETTDFFFNDIAKVHEVVTVLLEFTGAAAPTIQLQVGARDNQYDDIAWTVAKDINYTTGTYGFFIRNEGQGRLLRFRLTWANSAASFVTDLRQLSLVKVESTTNANPEK